MKMQVQIILVLLSITIGPAQIKFPLLLTLLR
jgi:hypothetical protein